MKRIVSIFLVLILCSSFSFADSSLTLDVDGKEVEVDGGATLVPAKETFEALGAKVEWNEETGDFAAVKDNIEVSFNAYSYYMTINGDTIYLDEDFKIVDDRVFIPLEVITKSMNVEIDTDNKIYIKSEKTLKKEYEERRRRLYKKYPRLYKAIEKIMEKPFEQNLSINMKVVNWNIHNGKDNEYTQEAIEELKNAGIDIQIASKIDYSKKKLESDATVSMKKIGYEEDKGFKTIVSDGFAYTKSNSMILSKTELTESEENKYFGDIDQLMRQLVKSKDNIERKRTKSNTIYSIKFDDEVYFDDFINILGEDNAILGELNNIDQYNDVKIKDLELGYTVDKEGNLIRNDVSAILEVTDNYFTIEILVTLKGEYKNIGKPLKITVPGDNNEESKTSIDIENFMVKKDEKNISLDLEATVIDGEILVPVKKVVEILGAEFSVDEASGDIRIEKDNNYILINEDDEYASKNGFLIAMPVGLQKRDGVSYVPLSFVVNELGGAVVFDIEKSTIDIQSVEAIKKDFEKGQKELEMKYPKLYSALTKLENKAYKQKLNLTEKVDNIQVNNTIDTYSDDYYDIQGKIDYLKSYDYKRYIYDELDISNNIRKSYFKDTSRDESDVFESELIVIGKKLYYKSYTYGSDEAHWNTFDLENNDTYFQELYNNMNIFRKDIVEEKVEDGTLFTIKVDSNNENKAALKRFLYDANVFVPYGFSKDDCYLMNLEIKYLVDKSGDMKSGQINYLIRGNYKTIQMDLEVKGTIEFDEIGKALNIEKPVKVEE
ncbi:copper amine oxidase N-terminal domain-containing protein [Wukongibacter sp. M2B1]|uniref:copper amine oxidase N-terminal domain-containing protein n=1 Tax=Wukongibacter sp. M2B1 TaxID=3088895 RepID=UPI003D7BBD5E